MDDIHNYKALYYDDQFIINLIREKVLIKIANIRKKEKAKKMKMRCYNNNTNNGMTAYLSGENVQQIL